MVALANFNAPNGVVGDTYNGYQIEAVIDAANGKYRWKLSPPTSLDAVVVNDITGSAPTTVAFAGVEKQLVSYHNTGSSIAVLTPGAGHTFSDGSSRISVLPGEGVSLTLKGTSVTVVSKQTISTTSVGRIAFQVATTTANETFTLPITSDPADAYTVDWGDGTLTTQAGSLVHTYAAAGTHAINIVGTSLKRFAFNGAGDRTKVVSIDVVDLDGFGMTDASGMWRFCNAAKTTFTSIKVNNIVNANYMFRSCSIGEFNITSVFTPAATNVAGMFYNCGKGLFPLLELNLPLATDGSEMFMYCVNGKFPLHTFKGPELLNCWSMFAFCRAGTFELLNWGSTTDPPTKATNLSRMFQECYVASDRIAWCIYYNDVFTDISFFAMYCRNLSLSMDNRTLSLVTNATAAFAGIRRAVVRALRLPAALYMDTMFLGVGELFVADIKAPLVTDMRGFLGSGQVSGYSNMPMSRFVPELGWALTTLGKIGTDLGTAVTDFQQAEPSGIISRQWLYFIFNSTALPFTDYYVTLDASDAEIDSFLIWLDQHGPAIGSLNYNKLDPNGWMWDSLSLAVMAKDSERSAAALTAKNNLVTKGWTISGSYT